MRIISIDVGIKNLAYCIMEKNGDDDHACKFNIIQWDVINLCGEDHMCNCLNKKTIKKKVVTDKIICNKKAIFVKDNNYFCQTHAKKSDYLLPNSSLKNIKKWKKEALISYALAQGIVLEENSVKDSILKKVTDFISLKTLDKITTISANEMTLIQMGVTLVSEFDKRIKDIWETIDHIIIENQISPIANRMKTLQGMIAQYFIMRGKPNISFISSINKLKGVKASTDTDTSKGKTYGDRKKEGVRIVKEELEKNNIDWLQTFLIHKKKDDLSDAFLQGIWYLNKKV